MGDMNDILLGSVKHGVDLSIKPMGKDSEWVMFMFTHPNVEKPYTTLYSKKSIHDGGVADLYRKLEISLDRFIKIVERGESEHKNSALG